MKFKTVHFHKWKYKSYKKVFLSPKKLNKFLLMLKDKLIIFDTRQSDEFEKINIKGSLHVNAPFLWDNIRSIDKPNFIIIVCPNKRTHAIEASKARKEGYKHVFVTVISNEIENQFMNIAQQ